MVQGFWLGFLLSSLQVTAFLSARWLFLGSSASVGASPSLLAFLVGSLGAVFLTGSLGAVLLMGSL